MGERGGLTQYAYWSDRKVREIAGDAGVDISPRWKSKISVFKIPGISTGLEFEREPRTLLRNEIADRLERAIGDIAVEDFVTPPKVRFAKGAGRVEFSHFICEERGRIVVGLRTLASDGTRVAVCLFGSVDNVAGFMGPHDGVEGGWSSSAMWSVLRWLSSGCAESSLRRDDMQSISVEAMKIAFDQGFSQESVENPDRPWMRGFTFADAADSEWFAQIYSDVVLDPQRWSLDEPVDRILVGAPLWVRTPRTGVRRYIDHRRDLNVQH